MIRIAVDAMGGDHAPDAIVQGAVQAVNEYDLQVWLVGPTDDLQRRVRALGYHGDKIDFVQATQVAGMGEHGASVVMQERKKRDLSILVATALVGEGKADAIVSAGSTGAQLAAAQVVLRRIKGIGRAAIGSPFPTLKGISILCDAGANPDCDAKNLLQFAIMGSIYASEVLGKPNPRVGLLSNGTEDTKGNALVLQAHQLLRESGLNFIGNIEGRDVPSGVADVIVCDGFTGNVVLKLAEGLGSGIFSMIKDEVAKGLRPKIGALLLKPGLRRVKARMDYSEYGGAPLLGVRGLSVICHGSSDAKTIKNAIRVARDAVQKDVINRITAAAAQFAISGSSEKGAENDA